MQCTEKMLLLCMQTNGASPLPFPEDEMFILKTLLPTNEQQVQLTRVFTFFFLL